MRKTIEFIVIMIFATVLHSGTTKFNVAPVFKLKYNSHYRKYIESGGFDLQYTIKNSWAIAISISYSEWGTGFERYAPLYATEDNFTDLDITGKLKYSIQFDHSPIVPYFFLVAGRNFNEINTRTTNYHPDDFYVVKEIDHPTNKEKYKIFGLGFGYTFPVYKNLYYDMNIETYSEYTNLSFGFGLGF